VRTSLEIFLCSSDGEAVWYHRCCWDVSDSTRPLTIAVEQVLAHGLGHLRYLVRERGEPYVAATADRHGFMPVLAKFPPTLAGRLDQHL